MMQNKPELKTTGLLPPEEAQEGTSVHVFGMNLEDRVVKDEESTALSFTSLPDKSTIQDEEDNIDVLKKRKFDAITGEEDESTVFQGDFKLFVWNLTTSNWIEKGRGQLKLNDSTGDDEEIKSRLIMRVNGTLRIILNVAIQLPTFKIIASTKNNIRFTDSQTVWAASGSYASQLNKLIEQRLNRMKEEELNRSKAESNNTPPKKTKFDSGSESPSNSKSTDDKTPSPVKDAGEETRKQHTIEMDGYQKHKIVSDETKITEERVKTSNIEADEEEKQRITRLDSNDNSKSENSESPRDTRSSEDEAGGISNNNGEGESEDSSDSSETNSDNSSDKEQDDSKDDEGRNK